MHDGVDAYEGKYSRLGVRYASSDSTDGSVIAQTLKCAIFRKVKSVSHFIDVLQFMLRV